MRIGFWGNFGTRNLGNECTLQAIVHHARRLLPRAELVCICMEPADTARRHGIRAFSIGASVPPNRPRAGRVWRILRRCASELGDWHRAWGIAGGIDVLVMTGTGMITDSGEGPLGLPYEILKWSVAARLRGCRLLFVSVGVESMERPMTRLFTRTALRLACYRSYRDGQSRDRLSGIGFAAAGDDVRPDLAFSLPESTLGSRADAAGTPPTVGVGLYGYRDRGRDSDAEAYRGYVDKMSEFVAWLLENGYRVRLLVGDVDYDEAVRRDVSAALASREIDRGEGRFVDEPAASVEQLIEQLAEADLVVATRFHNVVLALMLGKPVVSISYDEKNDALMAQMGLAAYCQRIDQLDVGRLIQQLRDLEQNVGRLRSLLGERCRQYRGELDEQYRRLFEPARVPPV